MRASLRGAILLGLGALAPLPAQGRLGVTIGASSARFRHATAANPGEKARTGAVVGVSVTAGGSGPLSIVPELLYLIKGEKYQSGAFTAGYQLAYLELPLLVRAGLDGVATRPFITLGPTVSMLLACRELLDGTVRDCESAERPGPSRWDLGLMAGVGAHLGRFTASVRYEAGLTSTSRTNDYPRNRVTSVMAGFTF